MSLELRVVSYTVFCPTPVGPRNRNEAHTADSILINPAQERWDIASATAVTASAGYRVYHPGSGASTEDVASLAFEGIASSFLHFASLHKRATGICSLF